MLRGKATIAAGATVGGLVAASGGGLAIVGGGAAAGVAGEVIGGGAGAGVAGFIGGGAGAGVAGTCTTGVSSRVDVVVGGHATLSCLQHHSFLFWGQEEMDLYGLTMQQPIALCWQHQSSLPCGQDSIICMDWAVQPMWGVVVVEVAKHPRCWCWQHHAFLVSAHSICQFPRPTLQ